MKNSKKNKRDEELRNDIREQRSENKGKTKLEQDQEEPVIGEERVEIEGFNSGNKQTPEGKGGEGQSAASVPYEKDKNTRHQNGE